jgi:hypothetical protein
MTAAQKEVPEMQATVNQIKEAPVTSDVYLGYEIRLQDGGLVATPQGWRGEVLIADTMPTMRRKIWRWWHQVQL